MNFSKSLLLTLILLGTIINLVAAEDRLSVDARSKALGLEREKIPDHENPVFALQKPLQKFQKQTEGEFQTEIPLPRFTDYNASEKALHPSRTLQRRVLKIIARGPGQIPHDFEKINIFLLIQFERANCALAAKALADNNTALAASHLAKSFQAAKFVIESEPTLVPYSVAVVMFKRNAYKDLLELFARTSELDVLNQIEALRRENAYHPDLLSATLRGETRYRIEASIGLKKYIQEQDKLIPGFWNFLNHEPLKSCTLDQLMKMNYQEKKSLHLILDSLEIDLRWARSGKPIAAHPGMQLKSKPRQLSYYHNAPNGLFEIFEDCGPSEMSFHIFAAHSLLDTFVDTTVAILRAETDGVQVSTLASLVPKYLKKVPIDFNDGKPLRYLPKKRVLYSVGTDMKDDRGVSAFDLTEEEDLDRTFDQTFKIPGATRRR